MTQAIPSSEYEKWQTQYPPAESNWQDLKRIGELVIPVSGLVFLTTIYIVIGYTFVNMESWVPENLTFTTYYLYLTRIILVSLIPFVLLAAGIRYVFIKARDVVVSLYQPASDEKISSLIRRRLLGIPPFPPPLNKIIKYPFIVLHEPVLEDTHWARWFGGPAVLVIYDGTALYIERGNRFSRVVGPGAFMPLLERYERIAEVVDLRPQSRRGQVEPWTKDGIHIKLSLKVEIQIHSSPIAIERSANLRYPFDPLAVKSAVEFASVTMKDGKLQQRGWLESAWGIIAGEVSAFVAGHSLDELFLAPAEEINSKSSQQKNRTTEKIEQILSRRISDQVTNKLQTNLQKNGIKVINIQVTEITVPKEIQELRTKYWESLREIISAQRNSRAEAERIRVREQAHAEAQRTLLMTIIQKLEVIDADVMTEPLILSLSNILDQGLEDPMIRPWIANESFNVLEKMRKLLKERF